MKEFPIFDVTNTRLIGKVRLDEDALLRLEENIPDLDINYSWTQNNMTDKKHLLEFAFSYSLKSKRD